MSQQPLNASPQGEREANHLMKAMTVIMGLEGSQKYFFPKAYIMKEVAESRSLKKLNQ